MSSLQKEIYGSIITPDDVKTEILSRLPMKSLMRFSCVCKQWYALIKNSNFIFKHLKNYNDDNIHLIISYEAIIDDERERILSLFNDKTLTNLSYQDLHMPKPGAIFGPYDGIFCLCTNNKITLWNLATRKHVTLPKCSVNFPRHKTLKSLNVGFGLDPTSNDYKLVFIRSFWIEKDRYPVDEFSHVALYSLSTNTWRILKEKWIDYNLRPPGIYLNGVFYWLAYGEDYQSKIVVSFNMDNEKFQELQTPYFPERASESLGLYYETLTVLLLDWNTNYFDMWMMKGSCWIKQLTVGPILGVMWPIGFWKNSGFFMESNNGKLLLYDLSSHEVRDLGRFVTGAADSGIRVHSYKESLARINLDDSSSDYYHDIPWHILGVYQIDTDAN